MAFGISHGNPVAHRELRQEYLRPLQEGNRANELGEIASHLYSMRDGVEKSKTRLKTAIETLPNPDSPDAVKIYSEELRLRLENYRKITEAYAILRSSSPLSRREAQKVLVRDEDEFIDAVHAALEPLNKKIEAEERASPRSELTTTLTKLRSELIASAEQLFGHYERINKRILTPRAESNAVVTPPYREAESPRRHSRMLWVGIGAATVSSLALLAYAMAAQSQQQLPVRRIIIQNPPMPYRPMPPPLPPSSMPPSQVVVVIPPPKNNSGYNGN